MKKQFFPRFIVPAVPVPEQNLIRFLLPQRQYYDITSRTELVWNILGHCSGYEPAQSIITTIAKESPEFTTDVIIQTLQALVSMGVVVDSRATHPVFHQHTINPPYFAHALTEKEVAAYVKTPRLAVKSGTPVPVKQLDNSELATTQAKRRSCRNFSTQPLTLGLLGHILICSYSLPLHSSPSAGGLYPLKLFVIVKRAGPQLQAGYYEYNPATHQLIRYSKEIDYLQIDYAFNDETVLHDVPVTVVIASDSHRHSDKYADRGYRYTLIEAGHVAQNIHLASAENSLATLEYGGFLDEALAQELAMNDTKAAHVQPLICVAIGYAASGPVQNPKQLLERLKRGLVGNNKPIKKLELSHSIHQKNAIGTDFVGFVALATGVSGANRKHAFTSCGTAASATLAQIKAIAEGYERYASGLVRVDYTTSAKLLTKNAEPWLNPNLIAPLTARQYTQLTRLSPFSETKTWQWVKGTKAATGEPIWVPVDLVFYPLLPGQWRRKACVNANSSGVAAYTDEAGAIERAVLELVERHALMENWFLRRARPRIPIKFLPYHWRRRIAYWQTQKYDIHVLDYSTHGVSVVNVIMVSEQYPCFRSGAAASLDSFEYALAKAFGEAELWISSMRGRTPASPLEAKEITNVNDHGDYYASPEHVQDTAWLWSGPMAGSLTEPSTTTAELLESLDAIIVQISPKEAPLSVVRVLSSKLVPIHFGYKAGHHTHRSLERQKVDKTSALGLHYFA